MVRKAWVEDRLFMDEAEGFLLSHALISPPRTWPPLPPELPSQSTRLQSKARKMDWSDGTLSLGEEGADTADALNVLAGAGPSGSASGSGPSGSSGGGMQTGEKRRRGSDGSDEANKERCVICLMALRDRTIVGHCGHEFCFECIGVWANQSRRCPLCSADMAPFLLHDLDNLTPTKFYLPPLPSRQTGFTHLSGPSRRVMERLQQAEKVEPDELDLQIERRKEIYQNELYCKHIASNPFTRYRPNPTPHEIAQSPSLIQRTTAFLRRELRCWSLVDVEFLTTHILSLVKAVDIRSDVAVRLLAEYLDPPTTTSSTSTTNYEHQQVYANGAEHFAHELYSWLRSPFKELRQWDLVAQYDSLSPDDDNSPSLDQQQRREANRISRRSRSPSRSPSAFRSHSRSPSRDRSPSPSPSPSRSSLSSCSPSPSRSLSPLPPRDPTRRDVFIAPASPSARRWDESDTWVDPEYAAWLEDERKRAEERLARKRARRDTWQARRASRLEKIQLVHGHGLRAWDGQVEDSAQAVELLPDGPAREAEIDAGRVKREDGPAGLTIRGAAQDKVSSRRLSLLERLAKAKAEASALAADLAHLPPLPENPAEINAEDLLGPSPTLAPSLPDGSGSALAPASAVAVPPDATRRSVSGLKETVRARLRLRLKLESERANWRHAIAESKAQELRRRLLEAKVIRQAAETDATLRRMDRLDRQREIRRRLMVEKMVQAETEGERRARELRERLGKEKRKRMLREVLLARKKSLGETTATGGGTVAGPAENGIPAPA